MLSPTLARLIDERLPGTHYGVFHATGEGRFFPDGTEEASGSIVTKAGEHYDYWTGWNAEAQAVRFVQWQRIDGCVENGCWSDDVEYREACRAAGFVIGQRPG